MLSDEEYAKIRALLHTAGLREVFYSSAWPVVAEPALQHRPLVQQPNKGGQLAPEEGLRNFSAAPEPSSLAADNPASQAGPSAAVQVLGDNELILAKDDDLSGKANSQDEVAAAPELLDSLLDDDFDNPGHYLHDPLESPRSVSPEDDPIRSVSPAGNDAHWVDPEGEQAAEALGDYMRRTLGDWATGRGANDGFSDASSAKSHDEDIQDPVPRVDSPLAAGLGNAGDDDNGSDDDDNGEPVYELDANDPNHVPIEDLFAQATPPAPSSSSGEPPSALQEDPLIRRAYVQAFIAASFHGGSHDLIEHMLKSERSNLQTLSDRLDYDFPGLGNMAVTLRTVERRLGVDPDQFITYYFHCDSCWVRHHSSELYELRRPACLKDGCGGVLYTAKKLSNGKESRKPTKPLPTSSLERNIQRILLRPGKVAEFSAWRRTEDDEPGHKPPVAQEDWPGSLDEDYRMFDMHDAWGWNAIRAGLKRRRGGPWEVEDVDIHEVNQRFVALACGLVIIFNIDW